MVTRLPDAYLRCVRCFTGWFGNPGTPCECGGIVLPDPLKQINAKMLAFLQGVQEDAKRQK